MIIGLTIHVFDSTGIAYDACQWNRCIKTGDILFIPDEKVIGLAHTWPVAITTKAGNLHSFEEKDRETALAPFSILQRTNAVLFATALGYPL